MRKKAKIFFPRFSSIIRTSAACYDADVAYLSGMLFAYNLQDVYGVLPVSKGVRCVVRLRVFVFFKISTVI